MEGRSRDHIVRQTIPNGGSGDWEGPAADGFFIDDAQYDVIDQQMATGAAYAGCRLREGLVKSCSITSVRDSG